jgi:hypothetical protein
VGLPETRAAALAAIQSWGKRRRALEEERDPLIQAVLGRNLATKEEIHQATGLGRTTIDRIAQRATGVD